MPAPSPLTPHLLPGAPAVPAERMTRGEQATHHLACIRRHLVAILFNLRGLARAALGR